MTDSAGTIEFDANPRTLVPVGLMMIALTGVSALFVLLVPDGLSFMMVVGWVVLIFFGAVTAWIMWRVVMLKGPVVIVSATGIRDVRLARETIPWLDVRGISTWGKPGKEVMVLDVAPDATRRLKLTPTARWGQLPNRWVGADGLCVSVLGINSTFSDLFAACVAYATAAHEGDAG